MTLAMAVQLLPWGLFAAALVLLTVAGRQADHWYERANRSGDQVNGYMTENTLLRRELAESKNHARYFESLTFAAHVIALADHLDRIAKVMQDIEWADSGDTSWTPELDAAIRSVLPGPAELAVSIEIAERASSSLRIALDAARASGGKPS